MGVGGWGVSEANCTQTLVSQKLSVVPDLEAHNRAIMLSLSIICASQFSMYRILRRLLKNRRCHFSFRWADSSQREHYLVICGTFCKYRKASPTVFWFAPEASRGPHFMASPSAQSCHWSIPKELAYRALVSHWELHCLVHIRCCASL